MARRPDSKSASRRTPVSSMVSITELVKNINPQHGEFTDDMLNSVCIPCDLKNKGFTARTSDISQR